VQGTHVVVDDITVLEVAPKACGVREEEREVNWANVGMWWSFRVGRRGGCSEESG
jgi:hypothetical protein